VQPLIPYFDVPVLQIGPLPIHGFGVLVALGFVFGGQLATDRARRLGLDADAINRLIGWLVVGTFVGGHVGYGLMYEPKHYFENPVEFLKVWHGLSSMGGFVVCVPLSIYFFWKNKLPILPYVDCLAYGLTMGWFLGRMGCTVAHDHPGTPANDFFLGIYCRPVEGHTLELPTFLTSGARGAPWGPCEDDPMVYAAHDMGFYEALWSLGMYGVYRFMDRVPRTPGIYAMLLGAAYGPVRFFMDFLRPESTDVRYLGLTPAQYWAAIFFLVCSGLVVWQVRKNEPHYWPAEPPKPTGA
jgi:phosphatidylglycerol:prolipoprotein diacylglycerol transferase